jgi:hypothetical protein
MRFGREGKKNHADDFEWDGRRFLETTQFHGKHCFGHLVTTINKTRITFNGFF